MYAAALGVAARDGHLQRFARQHGRDPQPHGPTHRHSRSDVHHHGELQPALPGAHIGDGNCDVYADFKYGDSFDVRIVPLSGSRFESLTELKRSVI